MLANKSLPRSWAIQFWVVLLGGRGEEWLVAMILIPSCTGAKLLYLKSEDKVEKSEKKFAESNDGIRIFLRVIQVLILKKIRDCILKKISDCTGNRVKR